MTHIRPRRGASRSRAAEINVLIRHRERDMNGTHYNRKLQQDEFKQLLCGSPQDPLCPACSCRLTRDDQSIPAASMQAALVHQRRRSAYYQLIPITSLTLTCADLVRLSWLRLTVGSESCEFKTVLKSLR
jgi:hypothetical protein